MKMTSMRALSFIMFLVGFLFLFIVPHLLILWDSPPTEIISLKLFEENAGKLEYLVSLIICLPYSFVCFVGAGVARYFSDTPLPNQQEDNN